MAKKPTYKQLEQRVKKLENESFELTQAVADLGKSEEDYRSMIEHTNDLIEVTTFSLNPTYTYISPSHKKIMGYEPEDVIGKSVFEMIHPDDKKKLLPLLKKYLKVKAKMAFSKKDLDFTERIEYRAKDKSGNWHYLQSTGNLIGNKLLFISRDITEKKKVEEKLKNSEEVFRTLTENTPIGVYYNDFQGRFLYGNKKAEEIIGYKNEELIGKNFLKLELLQFKDFTKAAKLLALNKLGKATGPDEFTLNKKDGSKVVVEVNTEIITIGGGKVVLGMVQDITEQVQAEKALRESERKHKTIIETSLTGFSIHQDGKYVFVNDRFAEIHGYRREELLGKDHLSLIHPDEREAVRKIASERLKGEDVSHRYEVRRLRKDGKIIWCEMLATRIRYREKLAIMGNIIDITERKQAEEEKEKMQAQLLQAQKMEAIGTLAGGIAHNFNNLLMSIQGNTSLML
ncbi:MAG: PAS domain S-box protein, partial [Deltaproteobacteria bacterium]|nr:PAS domain S-box protein [Deltaproteobacteria bacterium]